MQIGIMRSSDVLGSGRWDAEFHFTHEAYRDAAALLATSLSPEEAIAQVVGTSMLPLEVLRLLEPLVRGKRPANREVLQHAAAEYPYLALAIIQDKGEAIFAQKRAELEAEAAAVARAAASLAGTGVRLIGAHPIPGHLRGQLRDHTFVQGVIYFDGTTLAIPVETHPKAYLADCWVIALENWKGPEHLARLASQGDVPVPVRAMDLGRPMGYCPLPDHQDNYHKGWR